ncbi:MAG: DUF5063 domain-containing protein [Bacteroidetes bacterium]|nr:DUF5063 domain-containing protein [Bacteroidota bacterium]
MNQIPDHPVYSRSVLEFLTVANDYCITLSNSDKLSQQKLLDYLLKVLPLIYLKASLLPLVNARNPEFNEKFFTEEEWEALFNNIRNIFKKNDVFWIVDQKDKTNDMIKGSLAEHLTDIFQSLKDFLELYQKNSIDAKENAVEDVYSTFTQHWGYRLVDAHKTLHYLAMEYVSEADEPIEDPLL